MRSFAQLLYVVDTSRRTSAKLDALMGYFQQANPSDAAWALWFLMGKKLRLRINGRTLLRWCGQVSGYSDRLLQHCYERVGDSAETVALVLPEGDGVDWPLSVFIEQHLMPIGDWDEGFQLNLIRSLWQQLDRKQLLLCNKMLTGGLRIGVSRTLVVRALAQAHNLDVAVVQHRLMGAWQPSPHAYLAVIGQKVDPESERSRPYPFMLAAPLEGGLENLGDRNDWQVEWKWDGMRAQLIKRHGYIQLWSRGDEALAECFPELIQAAARIPGNFVLDGEILCWQTAAATPMAFAHLQTRITRKNPSDVILTQAPARFIAYDCLEVQGNDVRSLNLLSRREHLLRILPADGEHAPHATLCCSPVLNQNSWHSLFEVWSTARDHGTEGFMLKSITSPYSVGRTRGLWWKFKSHPFTIDLVLVYAQAGHGKRGGLFTDYTLAAWDKGQLVPVAKAYSGLSDVEIRQVNSWILKHTKAKQGPVRIVNPELVFEIAFEGVQVSRRHRSGLALRFPRIHRWRRDKSPAQADSIDLLRSYLVH